MKNILFLSSWYPSRVHTTLGNFVQYHAKAVARNNNIHVLYITPDDNINGYEIVHNKIDELDTTIVYFKRGLIKYLNYWIAFKKGLRFVSKEFNYDLVHMNIMHPGIWQALYLKWKYKKPYIVSENWHGFQNIKEEKISFFQRHLIKLGFKHAFSICPVSNQLKEGMIKNDLKANFNIIPNVVNTDIFSHKKRTVKDCFKFLHVSTLDNDIKNITGIINAFSKLNNENVILKIIGEGDKTLIQDLIQKLNLNDRIIVEGEKRYDEIAEAMHDAHAFILFSNIENLPLVLVEAMATGIPFIATNVGGIPEIYKDYLGFMINSRDEDELTKMMDKIIIDYNQFDSKKISDYANNNFSYNKIGHSFDELYNKMINK